MLKRTPSCAAGCAVVLILSSAHHTLAGAQTAQALFAGGCFWCMEEAFERLDGVQSVTSGYTGGQEDQPTYQLVSSGTTGHLEAVRVVFDPERIRYDDLLAVFWRNVDPTNNRGQFCDEGPQYRSAIFFYDERQRQAIDQSIERLKRIKPFDAEITTRIVPASRFFEAEDDHQNYYKRNPIRYRFYKYTCGRPQRLAELWDRQ